MKLRIKGNSIRFRLTRPEVETISLTGNIEEQTNFGKEKLLYALQETDTSDELTVTFTKNKITMFVPKIFLRDWPNNNVVGMNSQFSVADSDSLFLLLEKDFVCLDETTEDQTDNYENPNKTC